MKRALQIVVTAEPLTRGSDLAIARLWERREGGSIRFPSAGFYCITLHDKDACAKEKAWTSAYRQGSPGRRRVAPFRACGHRCLDRVVVGQDPHSSPCDSSSCSARVKSDPPSRSIEGNAAAARPRVGWGSNRWDDGCKSLVDGTGRSKATVDHRTGRISREPR